MFLIASGAHRSRTRRLVWILWLGTLFFGSAPSFSAETNRESGTAVAISTAKKKRIEFLPGLSAGASSRFRFEDKRDFQFGLVGGPANNDEYYLTQLRVNLGWKPIESLAFFVEGQDSRVFGERAINDDAIPNVFADEFDLHQAHVTLSHDVRGVPVALKVGRQKLNLGAQRLLASLEWVNTARVHDAIRLTIGGPERNLEIIGSRLVPVQPNDFNDWDDTGSRYFNSDLHTLYFTDEKLLKDTLLEAYYIVRRESDLNDLTHTLGGRVVTNRAPFDFHVEAAFQTGEYGDQDHLAGMLHLETGYTTDAIPILPKSRFSAAYNFGSGDDDAGDGTHGTFDNLYPLNHAYYGFMDFFGLQNLHNFELVHSTKIAKKATFRLAYQGFWLAEPQDDAWYNAGLAPFRPATAGGDEYVGSEIDVTLKVPLDLHLATGKLVTLIGYSHFFAGDFVRDSGGGKGADADFVFVQTKVSF
ncbi:MAG: alginate export family protein [bacterium]|nr:alginate export family protein [bacterium]